MIDIILFVIAQAAGGGGAPAETSAPVSTFAAEEQVATGRFLTALEVKPILTATRGNWVALRDWEGQDLLYVTHLWSWRCGLVAMRVGVNGEAPQDWPLPPCHADTNAPNAITSDDGLPYRAYPAGSIETVTVEITYDDLTPDAVTFPRAAVLMP
jgi:hypothetical protein